MAAKKPEPAQTQEVKKKGRAKKAETATNSEIEYSEIIEDTLPEPEDSLLQEEPSTQLVESEVSAEESRPTRPKAKKGSNKSAPGSSESEDAVSESAANEVATEFTVDQVPESEELSVEDRVETEEDSTADIELELADEIRDETEIEINKSADKPSRQGFWSLLKSWFLPRRSVALEPVETPSVTLTPLELEERIESAKLELEQAEKRVLELKELNQTKQIQAEALQARVDEIQEFISKVERSYFWKVQQQMEKSLSSAREDLETFEKAVENVQIPQAGLLIKLRKSFHKIVAITALFTGLVAAFTTLYPIVAYLRAPQWLQTIFDSTAFSSILVAMAVAAYGIIYLIRKFGGKDAFPVSRIVLFTISVILVAALFISWPIIEPQISQNVIPFLQAYTWQILTACGSIFLFALLVALLLYYAGWSKFRRDVSVQLTNLSNVIEGYVKTKQEVDRLEKLYKQTSDWLEILAHALYRPWKTHPDWEGTREFENHYSTFPFALRVAQAKEERDSRMAELERLVGGRLMVQGWRADAFNDMVQNAGLEMGLQEGKFTTDLLDADLPHETNNSRALLLRFLENSAKAESEGKVDLETTAIDENGKASLKPSDKYLVEVARERLLDLIEKTQSIVLSEARPRVLHIQDDPLAALREDQGGIEEYDPTHSWDEFLKESLGTDEVAQPPMGILNFSEKGRISRVQEDPSSFIITPKRLYSSLPPTKSDKISIVPVGDEKARAVEIIARVDVVGPLSFDQIALLSDHSAVAAEQTASSWEPEEEL
jgi:hypothetical protein